MVNKKEKGKRKKFDGEGEIWSWGCRQVTDGVAKDKGCWELVGL